MSKQQTKEHIDKSKEFEKALNRFINETHPASAGHFADTGKVSGSMYTAMKTFWYAAQKAKQ